MFGLITAGLSTIWTSTSMSIFSASLKYGKDHRDFGAVAVCITAIDSLRRNDTLPDAFSWRTTGARHELATSS